MKFDSFFSNGLKPPTRFSKESVLKVTPKNSGLGIMGTFCPDMFYHDHMIHGIGIQITTKNQPFMSHDLWGMANLRG